MLKLTMIMALNVETEKNDGFERQNWEAMMALNAKIKNDNGSKRRTENDDGSKRRSREAMMPLNAEIEKRWWL